MNSHSDSYAAAGVDITAGYRAVELMKKHVARTRTAGVVSGLGGFGGLFRPDLSGMEEPIFVSGTDGVGTKLKLAFAQDKHDTVGIDCVAMCVNDIVCSGARPLFFLDYIACAKNLPEQIEQIVAGVAEGCVQSGAALIGGETAEMPGFYPEGEYDVAGFAVGVVDRKQMLSPDSVQVGDVVLGLASSGVHSNGFSLVRHVLPEEDLRGEIGRELLTPTRIYVGAINALLDDARAARASGAAGTPGVAGSSAGAGNAAGKSAARQPEPALPVRSISHITGGGLYENLPRALGDGQGVRINLGSWQIPEIFGKIQRAGSIPERDMFNTFNMGLGMCVVVDPSYAERAAHVLAQAGQTVHVVGEVTASGEVEVA